MYRFYNPNPSGIFTDDCIVRAACKILDISWEAAYMGICLKGLDLHNMPDKNDKIADLQRQVSDATRREEIASLKASLLQDNSAQTTAIENYLNPTAIPAYIVQNPNASAGR